MNKQQLHKVGSRRGLYLLSCTKCKTALIRDPDSDWTNIWWWSRSATLQGEECWEYKEHPEDEGLLDLRGFTCQCTDENGLMLVYYWIWSRVRETVKYFKLRVQADEKDIEYIVQQLNQLAEEKKWNLKIG